MPDRTSMPRVALYAGSFDPITRGHEDVIRRSLAFIDLFGVEERLRLIRAALGDVVAGDATRVEVRDFQGLLVDFARRVGATVSIRGLRAVSDFEYEYQMALMNRHLMPELETLFMVPSVDLTYISSSIVREVARFGGDTSDLVHPAVARALGERFRT